MLRQITNWNELRDVLKAHGQDVYICEDCEHIWFGGENGKPARCPSRACRVWADGHKRSAPGRPFETCPQCGATDPKHPRKDCFGKPHAFHTGQ